MINGGKTRVDMCSGPIFRNMIAFSLPLMISGMLQLLFNAADVAVAGRFAGDESLAAVGSNGALINLFINVFVGFSIGTNVVVARMIGAGRKEACSKAVHTSFLISLFSGLFLTVFGELFAEQILIWMQTPQNVLPLAALYLRIYFIGTPSLMLYNFGNSVLRSVGDTKRPLMFLTISGVLNVVLNLFFVIVFKLDVAGVALATVISQTLSAGLVLGCLAKEEDAIRLKLKSLRIDVDCLKQIVFVGLPAGIQGAFFSISNVIIQSSVNSFGDVTMSGNAAAANIEGFIYTASNSFYQSTVSFTSQNMGAGNYDRVNKINISGVLCSVGVGCILSLLVNVFAHPLLGIYSTTEEVILAGIKRIRIVCIPYFLLGVMEAYVGSLRGIGYSVTPMIVTLIGACLSRIVWIAVVFSVPGLKSIENVYLSYPVSWFLTGSTHAVCFYVLWNKKRKRLAVRDLLI